MRFFQFVFTIIGGLGYLGNAILFLYVEWTYLQQDFIQIFNPLLHLKVLEVVLNTHIFWVYLGMGIVGYYAASNIDNKIQTGLQEAEVKSKKAISPFPQVSEKTQSSYVYTERQKPETYLRTEKSLTIPERPKTLSVFEQQINLLEWAIKSSQKIKFNYKDRNGVQSKRTVTPIRLQNVGENTYLEAYCHLRNARRTFVIKRMRDIQIISASEINYLHNSSQEVLHRPYINCYIGELVKIVTDNWNNRKVLDEIHYELEFRSRKQAIELREIVATRLTQLTQSNQLNHTEPIERTNIYSSTTVYPGTQSLSSDVFKYEEGLLKRYGYKVGMNGLSESKRRRILDQVFTSNFLDIDNTNYLSEWGEAYSEQRLQKLVESIAAFTRNAKRRNQKSLSKAIQDWEADLAYLKRTYYNNSFFFQYPRT